MADGPPPVRRLRRVLVANRGEIALRVGRTLRARAMGWVAVHTPADGTAPHVTRADAAVQVPSYLDGAALVAAAVAAGCDAVHPGYGFLSEDAGFAAAVDGAGLVWIGPPAAAIERMGDKIRAKETVAAAGVPVVPGAGRAGMDDAELAGAALAVGLPVLVKPSAGGGGKGMRLVERAEDLADAIAVARREAAAAFGDDALLVERFVTRPRHIEVQVFADRHGGVVHLGTRECSLQRRHQKIVEESPSVLLGASTRERMAAAALAVARSCGYVGAGTVEFVVPGALPEEFYFLEMNTRLQVEHPVTEAVTGLDLVDWQLRVAAGEPLPLGQDEIRFAGHAVEARVYAEDPGRGFLPSAGRVLVLAEPDLPGVRVDSALAEGLEVGTRFDPMLAKVVAHGADRDEALERLRAALTATVVLGVTTNVGHLLALLSDPDVVAGNLDTGLVERTADRLAPVAGDDAAARAAALALAMSWTAGVAGRSGGGAPGPWDVADGWRAGAPAETLVTLIGEAGPVQVGVRGAPWDALVRVGDSPPQRVHAGLDGSELVVRAGGVSTRWAVALSAGAVWVGRAGRAWRFVLPAPGGRSAGRVTTAAGPLTSPMPGVVVALHVAPGDPVEPGQVVVAVEAMKMEYAVRATVGGTVGEVWVRGGQQVGLDEPLLSVVTGPAHTGDAATQERVP